MEMLRNYYYSDHTSASLSNLWITDNTGEEWVDQRNSTWNAPYTFSGKEKDAETGYGYFGARYYDSGLSIWLSVDPMSDKYPSMSPYNYCANNPVILVDPDGRRTVFVPGLGYDISKPNWGPYAHHIREALKGYTASHGTTSKTLDGSKTVFGDMLHVMWNGQKPLSSSLITPGTRIHTIAQGIADYYNETGGANGEQMNVMGMSQGSVTSAQAVIDIFNNPTKYGLDENFKIDNLILGGSPIDQNSELYQQLKVLEENGKIGKIWYDPIEGDKVTGMAGTTRFQALKNGIGFVKRILSGVTSDPHAAAAADKDNSTTIKTINSLEDRGIY